MPKFVPRKALVISLAVACAAVAAYVHSRARARRRLEERERQKAMEYDIVIDIAGSPEKIPWQVHVNPFYDDKLDALTIAVFGDFNVGKTFLINRLAGTLLPSSEHMHTKGLSFKSTKINDHPVVWIDTQGHSAPYDVRLQSPQERIGVENLIGQLAYSISDIQVVVVSHCSLRDQEFINALHSWQKRDQRTGKDLLFVVHNYCRIPDPDMLEIAFQNDVVSRFGIKEIRIPSRKAGAPPKRVWVDCDNDHHPIYHVLLGKDGTPAGAHFNEQSLDAIFEMSVYKLGFHRPCSYIHSILEGVNEGGLLQKHLGCNYRVRFESTPDKQCVIALDSSWHQGQYQDNSATVVASNYFNNGGSYPNDGAGSNGHNGNYPATEKSAQKHYQQGNSDVISDPREAIRQVLMHVGGGGNFEDTSRYNY